MSKREAYRNFGVDFSISWMPNWNCNLNCEYCGEINIRRGLMPDPKGGSFNGEFREQTAPVHWSEWVRAFNELPGRALIDISGGEPFMYKDFIDVVTNIDERHLLAVTTNLTFPITHFIENVSPKKVISVTGSLHLNNNTWRTTFFERLHALWKAGFTTQCNFVAYPEQLHILPELHAVFHGRPSDKVRVRGEVLRPLSHWHKDVMTQHDGERLPLYSESLSKKVKQGKWNEVPLACHGTIYKNGEPLPFHQAPESQSAPAAKVYASLAFINEAAYDPGAAYTADYSLGDYDLPAWDASLREQGCTPEMKKFINDASDRVQFTIEPYSGGATVPFKGYTREEMALISRYSNITSGAIIRREIREIEFVAPEEKALVKSCNAGQRRFMIAPDGNIYQCNMVYMKRRELCMGNFLEIYRTLDERVKCDLPCTCGGDRENVAIEYLESM